MSISLGLLGRRLQLVLVACALGVAGCERAPLAPGPPGGETAPLAPYGPLGPQRPYGTDPSLASQSASCPDRCAVVVAELGAATPIALNEVAQILARDAQGTFFWSGGSGTTRLGLPGGAQGNFLTDWSYVVGGGSPGSGQQAFLWTSWGGVRGLGRLGGATAAALASTADGSRIVGISETAAGGRAFLWTEQGGMVELGGSSDSGASRANAIHASGGIAGSVTSAEGERAVVWDEQSHATLLPALPGYSESAAVAINGDGWVAGTARGVATRAWIWSAATGARELGTLGGDESEARAINSWGEVVGVSTTAGGSRHAFVWRAATGMKRLDALGRARSEAISINSWGDILGVLSDADGSNPQVVVWAWEPNLSRYGTPGAPLPSPSPVEGAITITFDDGWASTYDFAFPVLRDRGLRANVGVVTVSVDYWAGFLTLAQLRDLAAAGWAIVSHSVTHPHLTQVSDAVLNHELEESQRWIRQNGFAPTNVFIVPYHDWGPRELAAVKQHYGAARGYTSNYFWPERFQRWPAEDPHELTGIESEYYSGSFTTPAGREALRRKLEEVVTEGAFVDVFFHRITPQQQDAFRATADILAEFRDHIHTYRDLFPAE